MFKITLQDPNTILKKRLIIMGIALTIVFGGIIAFNITKSILIKHFFASYKPPAVSVSSAVAKTIDWAPSIQSVGNFVAINGVEVNPEASGKITELHFESGQYINKNAPLATMDDSIEQAALLANQAQLTLNELNFKRQTDLLKRGATPNSSVDEAKANLQQAQAKILQIQAEINQKHIKAPFSGRLGIRQVNLGQYVTPGQSTIVSLQSLDPLFLEFYLPEQLYKRIRLNQSIAFKIEGFPKIVFKGAITAINSRIDSNTHNILVQATLPNCPTNALSNPEHSSLIRTEKTNDDTTVMVSCDSQLNEKNHVTNFLFIPGMFASIKIEQPKKPGTIIIPSTAISHSLYGNSVYRIEKNNNVFTVKRIFVTTGQQYGNYTVIKKGIQAKDLVVRTGELKLQNGTVVSINNSVVLNDELDVGSLGQ